MDNTCICCGRPIPEGRFICLHCEGQNEMQRFAKGHGCLIESRYPNENRCSECGQTFRDEIMYIYPYDENGVCKMPKRCPECGCYWGDDAE